MYNKNFYLTVCTYNEYNLMYMYIHVHVKTWPRRCLYLTQSCSKNASLVPRPLPKEGRGPGIHCLRMREIFPCTYRKIVLCTSRATRMFCRICASVVDAKHSLALFSTLSMSLGWPTRIRELLRVDIASDDGLAQRIYHYTSYV